MRFTHVRKVSEDLTQKLERPLRLFLRRHLVGNDRERLGGHVPIASNRIVSSCLNDGSIRPKSRCLDDADESSNTLDLFPFAHGAHDLVGWQDGHVALHFVVPFLKDGYPSKALANGGSFELADLRSTLYELSMCFSVDQDGRRIVALFDRDSWDVYELSFPLKDVVIGS